MQRRWSGLRSLAALLSSSTPELNYHHGCRHFHHHCNSNRLINTSSNRLYKPLVIPHSFISHNFKPPHFPLLSHPSVLPSLSLMQVRHITAKQRERKLKSRKPMTPVTSKVKKIKIKYYSSFKGRFRVMNDGKIRRWKEGKRHNAHSKSKKSKRRLRQPGIVPAAYAKVMKKLNFCA